MRWSSLLRLGALAGALLAPSAPRADPPAPGGDEAALAALALALSLSPAPDLGPPGAGGEGATVELLATVRARAVSFPEIPRIALSLAGSGPGRTVWHTERVNLPARPEPGVVYRDVEVRLTLSGPPAEVEALLADGRRLAEGLTLERDGATALLVAPDPAAPAAAP